MQPTTLNRVVSLFLIGGIVILGTCGIVWQHAGGIALLSGAERFAKVAGEGFLTIIGGFLLISLGAVGGALSESLTGLTVRRWLKHAGESGKWSWLLSQGQKHKRNRLWEEQFKTVVKDKPMLCGVPVSGRELAVGIFYKCGHAEAVACAESNYGTFIMASNLVFLSGVLLGYSTLAGALGWWALGTALLWGSISIALAYTFASFSLDRYLSAYQIALRQSIVSLAYGEGEIDEGEGAHNPRPQPDGYRAIARRGTAG